MDTWESGQRRKAIRASLKGYTIQEHATAMDRLAADLENKGAHTPGPWDHYNAKGGRIFVRWRVKSAAGAICEVMDSPDGYANAQLLAAAPDLAEALRGIAAALALYPHWKATMAPSLEETARAALAKAGL